MARCGCGGAGSCACMVTAGTNVSVSGSGTSGSPYVISATPPDAAITDLQALDTGTIDMVVTGDGSSGDPYLVSANLLLSADVGNCATLGSDDALYVACHEIENVNAVAAAGSTETLPDVTTATIHRLVLDANLTLTFPAAAAGKSFTVVLVQDATGSRTVTWPGTVKWPGGVAPTLTATANKSDVFSFMCADGTNWLGVTAGQNYS